MTRSRRANVGSRSGWFGVVVALGVLGAFLRCSPGLEAVPPKPPVPAAADGLVGESKGPLHSLPQAEREIVDPFPDGRIWVRLRAGGAAPSQLSFVWSGGGDRRLVAPSPSIADPDGWWKVARPPVGEVEQQSHLAVHACGFSVCWLACPDPAQKHEIELLPSKHLLELRDAETKLPVPGARIRLSASPMGGCPWEPGMFPGPDRDTAVYHAEEQGAGLYRLDGDPADLAHHCELQHAHYVRAVDSPAAMPIRRGINVLWVQMPVVASIKYVGDEFLDGSISYPGRAPRDAMSIASLRDWRRQLVEKYKASLTVMFLNDPESIAGTRDAVASCVLQHGRRKDTIPVVRLAEFRGPVIVQVTAVGDEIPMQAVTIKGPPKFGDVAPNFKVVVNGGSKFPIRVVELGATLSLPPGVYHVIGVGDSAYGALEREKFVVRAGEPTTFELNWREGLRMYVMHVIGAAGVRAVQFECGEGQKTWSVTAPMDDEGRAVFWIRSDVRRGIVHAMAPGFDPVEVVFLPTQDPRVATGECRFISRGGR